MGLRTNRRTNGLERSVNVNGDFVLQRRISASLRYLGLIVFRDVPSCTIIGARQWNRRLINFVYSTGEANPLNTRSPKLFIPLLASAMAIVVAVTAATWWFNGDVEGEGEGRGNPFEALGIDAKYPLGTSEGDYHTIPLPQLVEESDLIVLATVENRSDQKTASAGEELTSLVFENTLNVERYLKGTGGETVILSRSVAMEVDFRQVTIVSDSPDGVTVGERYVFFLRNWTDGRMAQTGEPFRFLIEEGVVRPESTGVSAGGTSPDFRWLFPERTEEDFLDEVESLVAASRE